MKLINPLGKIPAAGDITPLDGCVCINMSAYTRNHGPGCNCQCDSSIVTRNANRDWAIQ